MANLMFVHGAGANAKSWFTIPQELAGKHGHHVEVVQLPGHDKPAPKAKDIFLALVGLKPFKSVFDFDTTMSQYLAEVSKRMGQTDDWILIGHSMGGMVISQIAASKPESVAKLIYVAAILPSDGKSVASLLDLNGTVPFLGFLGRVREEFEDHKGSGIDAARSIQPFQPLNEPFRETPAFADKKRYYIRCDEDGVILPEQQKAMIEGAAGGAAATVVEHLDSDHLPQLSVPEKLVEALQKAIDSA